MARDEVDQSTEAARTVAEVLVRPDLNGIYRLSRTIPDLQPLLDGRELGNKSALLAGIAGAFEFPDYFGENWDALEECLRDMSWRGGRISLLIEHADAIPLDLLATFLDIAAQMAEQWASEGRVCSVFLCDLPDGPVSSEIPLLA